MQNRVDSFHNDEPSDLAPVTRTALVYGCRRVWDMAISLVGSCGRPNALCRKGLRNGYLVFSSMPLRVPAWACQLSHIPLHKVTAMDSEQQFSRL